MGIGDDPVRTDFQKLLETIDDLTVEAAGRHRVEIAHVLGHERLPIDGDARSHEEMAPHCEQGFLGGDG